MEIKYGSTRIVLLTKRYAFKIPCFFTYRNFLYGLIGNLNEYQLSPFHKEKLCPVVFSLPFGLMNVMPRAIALDRERFFELDYDAFVKCENGNLPIENKLDSFGLLNGKIVAIDYG